jgi:hypothetical protein
MPDLGVHDAAISAFTIARDPHAVIAIHDQNGRKVLWTTGQPRATNDHRRRTLVGVVYCGKSISLRQCG